MELRDLIRTFQRRWLTVLVITVATVVAAAALTFSVTPQFTATTQLFFTLRGAKSVNDLTQGSNYLESQMSSYVDVATSPLILGQVIDQLNLKESPEDLAKSVTAEAPADKVILNITVKDPNAQKSAQIANAVADRVIAFAKGVTVAGPAQDVRRLANAKAPTEASSPKVARNLILSLVAGLLLGVAGAFARDAVVGGRRQMTGGRRSRKGDPDWNWAPQ